MALLKVIEYGHPTLRQTAEPCVHGEISDQFIEDMLETMRKKDGVGLAAPQVNVSKRLIVCTDGEKDYVLFNPKIIAASESIKVDYEGCLSFPGLHAKVPRAEKVIVQAISREWRPVEITARGLFAVVLQHEIDHLNGVFYIDRADLSSLSWTDAEIVAPHLRDQITNIEEIQQVFIQTYHRTTQNCQFEKA
ncbi:MAG: peptide deformylase [Calditrichaeota bacterium]|nr:MAG: peptide deformylase [Calditrichota bacterium]